MISVPKGSSKACHHSEGISNKNSAVPADTFNIFLGTFLTETLVRHKYSAVQLGCWGQSCVMLSGWQKEEIHFWLCVEFLWLPAAPCFSSRKCMETVAVFFVGMECSRYVLWLLTSANLTAVLEARIQARNSCCIIWSVLQATCNLSLQIVVCSVSYFGGCSFPSLSPS